MKTMSEYLSAAELAQLSIPSLPKTPKGISDKAKREYWPSRRRVQRGGGVEYQVAGLPETIQTAVRERQAEQLLAQSQPAVLPSVAKAKRPVAVRRMEQLGLAYAQAGGIILEPFFISNDADLAQWKQTKWSICRAVAEAIAAEVAA